MRRIMLAWIVTLLAACGGGSDGESTRQPAAVNAPKTLTSISVTPGSAIMAKGLTTQLTATGTYSDSTTAGMTAAVTWTSSAPSIVSIDASGVARGLAVGSATITASSGSITGSATVNVTDPSLQSVAITPSPAGAGVGMTLPFTATGTYSDSSTADLTGDATWSSSNPSVATINSATGVATGVTVGTTTIIAAVGALNASATLAITVSGWYPAAAHPSRLSAHTATLIDGSRVLNVGGQGYAGGPVRSDVTIYDSARNSWSAASSLSVPRAYHSATRIADGRVLVVGGANGAGVLASAEIYDPLTNSWSAAGQLAAPRENHTATLLADGRILVTGGDRISADGPSLATAELYDPVANAWSAAPDMSTARNYHTAAALPDGKVLVAGGWQPSEGRWGAPATSLDGAELYDPVTNTWSPAGSMTEARHAHTATALADGRILVTAGYRAHFGTLSSAEVYDSVTNTWSSAGTLAIARKYHTATLLNNGKVLVAGGMPNVVTRSVELYDPVSNNWSPAPEMIDIRMDHTATLLPSGAVLVTGGATGDSVYLLTSELYW